MSNSEIKVCQNCKNQFTIEPEDFQFHEKIKVPPPTFCPTCRFQRRCAYRNERSLKRAVSAKSGENIFTLYPKAERFTLFTPEEWFADDWDQMATGRDYDFNRTFFEQVSELFREAPIFCRNVVQIINSDYCANVSYVKNCYLIFQASETEDSAYGNAVDFCKNCFDNSHITKCELCYDSFWLTNCYQTYFSSQCTDCNNVWFSKNCRGCSNCVGCVNLTNKQYCIFNEQYSKEEYEQKIREPGLNTWSGLQRTGKEAYSFWKKFPVKFMEGTKNDNVTGQYINDSKNVQFGYLVRGGRDLKYCQYQQIPKNEDCYDITIWGENNQLGYENMATSGNTSNTKFSVECWGDVRNIEYSFSCVACTDIFGCVGLRKKQYCILNKQYSKEEYFKLRDKIIQHMNDMPYVDKKKRVYKYGEFYPIELSPYGYNTDMNNDHFPMTKEEALAEGYNWHDIDKKEFESTMKAGDLPDAIDDIDDSVIKELIACADCGRAYRIIQSELDYLRNQKIPLPRQCIDCRHRKRIAERSKIHLYNRQCECAGSTSEDGVYVNTNTSHASHDVNTPCPNTFKTAYAPDNGHIVYCEECYQKEVV
jgi:hypothetical protein